MLTARAAGRWSRCGTRCCRSRSGAAGRSRALDRAARATRRCSRRSLRSGSGRPRPGVAGRGRPTIAMQTYVRLMVVKHRTGWGYETLMREVSDSIHLRRFCLIAIDRAGAGRVDGPQAHPPAGCGGGARDHPDGDREGAAREALPAAGGQDRLDRRGGRRALADRRRARADGVARARAGGHASSRRRSARSAPRSAIARGRWAAGCGR